MKSTFYKTFLLSLAGACVLGGGVAAAQQGTNADTAAEFATLSSAGDTTAGDWFALAQRARAAGDLDTAGQALELASSDGISPVRLALERARILVLAGDGPGAVDVLRGLFEGGFASVAALTADEIIGGLAGQAAFDDLVDEMSVQAYPCEHREGFGDFDFWLGDWVVHTADGRKAGDNRIESAQRGCVLIENWTNTVGGTGMSINYLDGTTGEWVQVWNAEGGTQIDIRGGLTDDGMRLVGHIHDVANDTTADFRGLWSPLPDGRVRQFFEQSSDGGATWSPWFEGFYTRKTDAD